VRVKYELGEASGVLEVHPLKPDQIDAWRIC
jgi:hypothetical protein